jgi:uncharacterized protein DUF4153
MMTLGDPPRPVAHDDTRRPLELTRPALLAAATLGLTADALFSDGPGAVAVLLWTALLAFNLGVLSHRAGRSLPREARCWLAGAALFAAASVWRNSDMLVAVDVCGIIGCMTMAAVTLRAPNAGLTARRFQRTLIAAVRAVGAGIPGVLLLAAAAARARESDDRRLVRRRTVIRAAAIVLVLTATFGAMLGGADPIFASYLDVSAVDVATVARHVLLTIFFAWIAGGWIRSALTPDTLGGRASDALTLRLTRIDVTAALATLIVLFALFMLTQLGWFFGGEAFLRQRTGLTAAQYARRGFFELAWIVALVVPVLVVTRAGLPAGSPAARRHTQLAVPLIFLLGAMILSAALRMRMYVHIYGLTLDRLYPMVFMAWLAMVLVCLAATVVRGRGRLFVASAFATGVCILAALHVVDPDALVARVNVARAHVARGGGANDGALDVRYLARLDGGAVAIATAAILSTPDEPDVVDSALNRCAAAQMLLRRWGPTSSLQARATGYAAWRFWNIDDARAVLVVNAHRAQLRALVPYDCVRQLRARDAAHDATQR